MRLPPSFLKKNQIKKIKPNQDQLLKAWLTLKERRYVKKHGYLDIDSKLIPGAFYRIFKRYGHTDQIIRKLDLSHRYPPYHYQPKWNICMVASYSGFNHEFGIINYFNDIDNFITRVTALKISEYDYLKVKANGLWMSKFIRDIKRVLEIKDVSS